MGEIAEMMLDGTLCECCGEYIGYDDGYPQYCSDDCAEGRGATHHQERSNQSDCKKLREKNRKKRRAQKKLDILKSQDHTGWGTHTEYHWYKTVCGLKLDFWPSGKKAMFNGVVYKNVEDIDELVKAIKENFMKEPK